MRRRDVLGFGALGLLGGLATTGTSVMPGTQAVGGNEQCTCRGTGTLGIVIERASGSVLVVDNAARQIVARVEGLGDLSHASAVFSPDERFAYIFGRDGGLTKVDLLHPRIVKRIIQGGNSIGGAISDDGRLIAVSNYKPGGVKVFSADDLSLVADIPASWPGGRSKVVGLVDAPGRRFLFSLYEAGDIRMADFSGSGAPRVRSIGQAGDQPYDALITADGRYYIAGLFGEDGMALVDLWAEEPSEGLKVRRILDGYGRGEKKLPVYKMPHLEGWTQAGGDFFLPAVGRHEVLVMDGRSFELNGRIPVAGQPVFVMARPDGRFLWVNFAVPDNHIIQIIDTPSRKVVHTLKPGRGVMHMEFVSRGAEVWMSVRDENRIDIFDTHTFKKITSLQARAPSGIFFTPRAHRIGL